MVVSRLAIKSLPEQQKHIALIDSDLPADDIDILFSQLQTIEPPPTLTACILDQLPPRPAAVSLFLQPMALHSRDAWTERNERRRLC